MDSFKKNIKVALVFICVTSIGISGCKTHPSKYPTSIDQMQASLSDGIRGDRAIEKRHHQVPRAVREALLPSVSSHSHSDDQLTQRHFNVAAEKVPAKAFFTGLVDGTPYNMVVSPEIEGTITLNLKNVTVEEAMAAVRDIYGYDYRKTSYGFEVLPAELESEIFNVNYLDVKRSGKSTTEMISGQVSDKVGTISVGGGNSTNSPTTTGTSGGDGSPVSSSSVNTTSETNFWHDLDSTLKSMVPADKGRSIIINPQAGVVTVHAYPIELHRIARYLDRIQSNLQRQVIIEAKVLEVQLGDGFDSGIDWSLLGNPLQDDASLSQSGNGPNTSGVSGSGAFANTLLQDFNPIFTVNLKGSFRLLMKFLQTQGNVQTLSSPRISTVNNQKAVIKVGQDEFFVTGVSTTNTIIGSNTLPSQNVNLTPFFSGVTLDVTPQIGKNGNIILHIHPSVSQVREQQKNITLGSSGTSTPNTLSLPLALSTIRESDNIVRAKSGQVVVIGGLMQNATAENTAGTPGLSRIPFIGAFFRRTSQVASKSELVILLRPVIVDNHTWTESLERADQNIQDVRRGFHIGGLPDVFGDEAERTDS
ncbi:MAG: pilus (MSHA type) biogenesis protein MshL [Gammaproteobacteria bacterium]|nr:pilus (MSHA type) biogenesis protein MshL [Gammaproteobacteria bacterium]